MFIFFLFTLFYARQRPRNLRDTLNKLQPLFKMFIFTAFIPEHFTLFSVIILLHSLAADNAYFDVITLPKDLLYQYHNLITTDFNTAR